MLIKTKYPSFKSSKSVETNTPTAISETAS